MRELSTILVHLHKRLPIVRKCSLAIVFMLSAFFAHAQNKGITLEVKNARRSEVLNAVKRQVNVEFFYNVDDLNRFSRISLSVKNQPLTAVLDKVLEGTGMKYQLEKNVVTISSGMEANGTTTIEEKQAISGKVTTLKGEPLPGATIVEAGGGRATTSGADGSYNIVVSRNASIRISYLGMKPRIVAIKSTGVATITMNIQLEEDQSAINEVVVTGYQNIERRNMAGAYATVKAEDIKIAGINSIDQLLQGQLPGVAVMQSSGVVGAKTKVRTRGTSTMLGSQDPVWVVDGVIQNEPIPFEYNQVNALSTEGGTDALKNLIGNAVSFLNVEDIQDITVLKDASSTAIYGVKAANGVIVITTKKGKVGKTALNYSTNITMAERPSYNMFNLMNSKERIDVSKEIYARGLQFQVTPDNLSYEGLLSQLFNKQITQEQFVQGVNKLETNNTDWFNLLFRTPVSSNHNLSLSGGTDRTTFYVSLGAASQSGNSIGNDMNRYNANVKVNTTFTDKLRVGFNLSGSTSQTNGFYQFDPFRYAFNTSRAMSAYNDDGTPYFYRSSNSGGGATTGTFKYNAVNERNNTGLTNKLNMIAGGYNLEYKIIPALTFESLGNYSITQTNGESFATERSNYIAQKRNFEFGAIQPGTPEYLASALPIGGVLNEMNMTSKSYTFRNTLSYNTRLRDNHDGLNIMAGIETRSLKYDGHSVTNYGYLPDRGRTFAMPPMTITPIGLPAASNTLYNEMFPIVSDKLSNYLSYFATAAYNWQEKYILNASIRTDASNRFGQDANHRFLPVWALGARWNVAEENIFNKISWLNQLTVRATYGFQGNVAENFSPELIAMIPPGTGGYSTSTGEALMKIYSLAYRDLRWEKNKSVNLGMDISILKNRVSATVDFYQKKTVDAIVMKPIPYEYGMTSMPINAGTLMNKGYEITLNVVPVRTRNFNWSVRFNTAKNFNEIADAGVVSQSLWSVAAAGGLYKQGYPVSGFWAFDYAGLDANGRPFFNKLEKDNPAKSSDATLGMVYVGQKDPKFTGGLGNNFQYKNFSLNVLFNIALGHHKFLPALYSGMYNSAPYPAQNLQAALVDRWRKPGDEKLTNIPSLPTANVPTVALPFGTGLAYSPYQLYDYSTARIADASFVRCQNISFGYRIPDQLIKSTKVIRQCTLQGSVYNLFYIASKDLHGVDPEVADNNLPLPRSFSLTLNVGF